MRLVYVERHPGSSHKVRRFAAILPTDRQHQHRLGPPPQKKSTKTWDCHKKKKKKTDPLLENHKLQRVRRT
eukprot:1920299-Rhodomonas_salina.1